MEAVRRANPTFTNFKSNTAVDAVEQFGRMQRNGLAAQVIPEALIQCAKGLNDAQMDLFEQWIINPEGVEGMDAAVIGRENYEEHCRIAAEHERKCRLPKVNESVVDPETLETCTDEKVNQIE